MYGTKVVMKDNSLLMERETLSAKGSKQKCIFFSEAYRDDAADGIFLVVFWKDASIVYELLLKCTVVMKDYLKWLVKVTIFCPVFKVNTSLVKCAILWPNLTTNIGKITNIWNVIKKYCLKFAH